MGIFDSPNRLTPSEQAAWDADGFDDTYRINKPSHQLTDLPDGEIHRVVSMPAETLGAPEQVGPLDVVVGAVRRMGFRL